MNFKLFLEENAELEALRQQLIAKYTGLDLWVFQSQDGVIHISNIETPRHGEGIGTAVMQQIQNFAKRINQPIVLSPEPGPGKKAALLRFYTKLGFVHNKGRNKDYRLSSMFGPTMIWRPRFSEN
jgi:GNAT superfamily N-acetyltransferase